VCLLIFQGQVRTAIKKRSTRTISIFIEWNKNLRGGVKGPVSDRERAGEADAVFDLVGVLDLNRVLDLGGVIDLVGVRVRLRQSATISRNDGTPATHSRVRKLATDADYESVSKWQPENVMEDMLSSPWTNSNGEFSAIILSVTVTEPRLKKIPWRSW
jgi:hypothetical protein